MITMNNDLKIAAKEFCEKNGIEEFHMLGGNALIEFVTKFAQYLIDTGRFVESDKYADDLFNVAKQMLGIAKEHVCMGQILIEDDEILGLFGVEKRIISSAQPDIIPVISDEEIKAKSSELADKYGPYGLPCRDIAMESTQEALEWYRDQLKAKS